MNRALRRIFKTKKDEVTSGWRMLRNVELRNLYSLPRMCKKCWFESLKVRDHY